MQDRDKVFHQGRAQKQYLTDASHLLELLSPDDTAELINFDEQDINLTVLPELLKEYNAIYKRITSVYEA